ncbi:type I secretion system permease/ATPase [Photobacterium nomapromontoriensis]|uniref:type I secretion system permease/ATPase n=1 Tax=Photobacterium nomapromontoriensis TaxID=2910237 RepID=UPI003D0B6401
MSDPLLNALITVCQHYGLPCSRDSLLAGLALNDGYLSPPLFVQAAENAGLKAKETHLGLSQISPLLLPVVAMLTDNRACVVLAINDEQRQAQITPFTAEQTDSQQQWIDFDELEQQFLNRVFLIKRHFQFDARSPEQFVSPEQHWFWGTLWQSKAIYRDVFIASILINLFAIATPLFTRLVYDKIVPNQAFDSLWVLVSGMAIIFLFDFLLKTLRSYFIDLAGKKSDLVISSAIYRKVMGIKMAARPPSVGAFARHLQEFESIRELFTSATLASLIDLPFALLFLLVIWLIAGPLVFVPIIAVILLALFSLMIQRPLRNSIEQGSKLASQKHANLIESLAGLETVKQHGAQHQFQYKWEQAIAHMANWGMQSRRLTDSIGNLAGFTQQTVSVAVIVVGVYLIANGQLSVGGLIAASMLTSRAIAPMVQLSQLSTRYHQAKSAMTIINDIMAMPDDIDHHRRYLDSVLSGAICCDNLCFSYPCNQQSSNSLAADQHAAIPALHHLNLTIQPGEKVAIIGKIGAGKSTLQRLLCGLYSPSEGSIRFDNIDIHQLHPLALRRQIGCVSQDTTLFYGSIRDNITLGNPQSSDTAIHTACEQAGVNRFTHHEPDGLDRQVGEGGHQLSGGQKQAIAIARALLSQPKILIFDEPTSNMDSSAEQHLRHYLSTLDTSHTLLLFTHKTSMLEVVDRLIVLDRGQVVADGEKEAVLRQMRGERS